MSNDKLEDAIKKYYDATIATNECADLMSSAGWVDGKAAKIMTKMYEAQSEMFALIGIDYYGGHINKKRKEE